MLKNPNVFTGTEKHIAERGLHMEQISKEYRDRSLREVEQCEDLSLLDLVHRILVRSRESEGST